MDHPATALIASVVMFASSTCWAQGTVPMEEAPAPLKPAEAAKKFNMADGLEIGLVAAEPQVAQPLSITFDDRGRMWVLQYRQFPNPNGLTPVRVDNWLRTKYDRIPDPPPKGPKGNDRISIYEDTNGDGRADVVKHFLSDLNLASGMAIGHGGVFVVQSPYLLFYADRNQDDRPDGNPEVLLTGFGMDDAHAFANSLTWGPDGWLYGAQGSTATAEIRGIGFQQGVWRYHPRTKEFELFAEGGGNTWGIDFDRFGNIFAGGNTVEPLVHHVQGAYYVKGFGKHGPLHNPHSYGYFKPVKHHGYAGDSLTGGFVLYQGGAFPERFNGHCIAPNTRHSASRWSTVEVVGSTFATRASGDFITTSDIWFRPVDSTVGPDGALYVADWYDYNISHSSPKNRSQWYQPSRADGRVWRVAPAGVKPIAADRFDLSRKPNEELVELLSHPNDWYACQARRLFAERRDQAIVPALKKLLDSSDHRLALQALWSIYVSDGFDDSLAEKTLNSPHEYVRAWTVRLLGDAKSVDDRLQSKLVTLAHDEASVVVRSQLACTAKRLPADAAMPIVAALLRHDEDVNDAHVPLLLWWAIEDKAISGTSVVLRLFETPDIWQLPIAKAFIVSRLARRLAAEGTESGYAACAQFLALARTEGDVDLVLQGMVEASSGRRFESVPASLKTSLADILRTRPADSRAVQLALRMGGGLGPALRLIEDPSAPTKVRVEIIRAAGEAGAAEAVDLLLQLVGRDEAQPILDAALSALAYFDNQRIARKVRSTYPALKPVTRARAIDLLCGRPAWALELLAAIEKKEIDAKAVTLDQVRQLLVHDDEGLRNRVTQTWGRVQPETPLQKQGRISAVTQLLRRAKGDAARGLLIYEKTCAACHKLHGKGTVVGPDLTGAERKDRLKLIRNIVDPSSEIRPQYISHIAVTTSGRVLTGLLADSNAETITLLDAKNKRTVLNRSDLEELRESTVSLMPEKLLDELTDQQIRDLLAYVQSDGPGK
ncbi:MAG: putative membrane-bound dehydrogenase-like protein [Planctomycetaceae bacterium]|jgi:putative membrane-bound dehydrogenase-like protein